MVLRDRRCTSRPGWSVPNGKVRAPSDAHVLIVVCVLKACAAFTLPKRPASCLAARLAWPRSFLEPIAPAAAAGGDAKEDELRDRGAARSRGTMKRFLAPPPVAVAAAAHAPAVSATAAPPAARALAASLESLRPGTTADVHALTRSGASWLIHAKNWWPLDAANFEDVWRQHPPEKPTTLMFGKKATFHRYQNTYGVSYKFAGQESVGQPMAGAPAAVRAFDEVLRTTEALREYNSILLNYYDADPKDGGPRHYMGPHSDDEKSLMPLTPIISLSWCTAGHARKFRFIPKPTCADALVPPGWAVPGVDGPVVTLRNGDLVVMGGTCQRTHKHEVMQVLKRSPLEEQSGRRINLTFRWFGAAEERKRKREGAPSAAPRVELACSFAEKDQVKALGAQWDPERKVWWVPADLALDPFARWLP